MDSRPSVAISSQSVPQGAARNVRSRRLRTSTFWSIRRGIPRHLKILMPILGAGGPLLAWTLLSQSGLVSNTFLPTPIQVLRAGVELWDSGLLLGDMVASCSRVLLGFLAAALVSIPMGLLMGTFHTMESLLSPIVGPVRYLPVAAFVPLVMIWAGIGEPAKILIVFLGVVLYNITMIADAVKFIPDEVLNAAYTLGASRPVLLFQVIFPAALPSIIDTMRTNIAGAWNFLILSELIAAQQGLGFRIIQSQRYIQTDKVLFCICIIGIIGLLTDYALKKLAVVLTPWADHDSP
ncbi:MAG: ABC transporter permease [Synechococcales cyanobacterium CRU_2_2]|nr:ABC transporter permease [Synechococcales cyanobacterium CRU_2_2]